MSKAAITAARIYEYNWLNMAMELRLEIEKRKDEETAWCCSL